MEHARQWTAALKQLSRIDQIAVIVLLFCSAIVILLSANLLKEVLFDPDPSLKIDDSLVLVLCSILLILLGLFMFFTLYKSILPRPKEEKHWMDMVNHVENCVSSPDFTLHEEASPECKICLDEIDTTMTPHAMCFYCRRVVGCQSCIKRWLAVGQARSNYHQNGSDRFHSTCPNCLANWVGIQVDSSHTRVLGAMFFNSANSANDYGPAPNIRILRNNFEASQPPPTPISPPPARPPPALPSEEEDEVPAAPPPPPPIAPQISPLSKFSPLLRAEAFAQKEDNPTPLPTKEETPSKTSTARKKQASQSQQEAPPSRAGYVEEPPTREGSPDRRGRSAASCYKEKEGYSVQSLLRQPVFAPGYCDMQVANYIHKMEITEEGRGRKPGGKASGVNRINSLRVAELGLRRVFWALGKSIANHKIVYVLLALVLFGSTVVFPLYHRDKLFFGLPFAGLLPGGAAGLTNSVSAFPATKRPITPFNESNANFDAIDRISPYSYSFIMKTLDADASILTEKTVEMYANLKRRLKGFDPRPETWPAICAANCGGEKEIIDRIIKKSPFIPLTWPETFVSTTRDGSNLTRLFLAHAIGGVDTDMDGAITGAHALRASFRLRPETPVDLLRRWRFNYNHQVDTEAATNTIVQVDKWSYSDFASSIVALIRESYTYGLSYATIVLMVFCFLSTFGPNAYKSKPMVGFMMGVALLMSCAGAAFVQLAGVGAFQPLIFPVFFVVIGIGLLFFHSLHYPWDKFSAGAIHPAEKLAFLLAHEGPGIALAAFIIAVAYLTAALLSPTPFMQSAFLLIAGGAVSLLVFGLAYISVFVYTGGRREAQGIKWFQLFKTGDNQFAAPQMASFDSFQMFSMHDRLIDSRSSPVRKIGSALVHRYARYPIVFFCTLYLIYAVYGCANAQITMREDDFLPASSNSRRYLDSFRQLFGHTEEYLELSFDYSLDYFDDHNRKAINELLEWAVTEQYATRSISWLTEFARFEKTSIYEITHDTFVPVVSLAFLATDPYKRFASDVIFDRFQAQIVRSRMYLELSTKGVAKKVQLIETLLKKARAANLPLSVRAPFIFSLQHDLEAMTATASAFFLVLAVVLVLSLILFGQPAMTLLILFTSVAVLAETIAYASAWGVPLNLLTFTVAIAANALTCVIVMSFCYNYSMAGRSTLKTTQRIQYTFQSCLPPVAFACFVPCITYVPLLTIDAPIIMHLFKILLVSSLASMIHFLFFLPNMLILLNECAPRFLRILRCEPFCAEDDGSIYYIPTAPRPINPTEGIYHHADYTYTIPRSIAPPHYLAIAGPEVVYAPPSMHGGSMGTGAPPIRRESSAIRGMEDPRTGRPRVVKRRNSVGESYITGTDNEGLSGGTSSRRPKRRESGRREEVTGAIYEDVANRRGGGSSSDSPRSRSASPQRVRVQRGHSGRSYYEDVQLPPYALATTASSAGYHVSAGVGGQQQRIYGAPTGIPQPAWKAYAPQMQAAPAGGPSYLYYQSAAAAGAAPGAVYSAARR